MQVFKKGISLVLIQWIAWVFVYLVMFLLMYHEREPIVDAALYALLNCVFFVGVAYANSQLMIPYIYRRRSKWLYVLAVIVLLTLMAWGLMDSSIWLEQILSKKAMKPRPVSARYFMVMFFLNTLVFIFSIPLRFALDYFTVRRQQEELQKRTAEAELNLLKAQVQPHFLFNTLNNIYFVAQRESPATAELLERLSNIMRYFVDEGPKSCIPLTKEIDFIRDYIHLEKMRMRHAMQVDITITGEPAGVNIPPMLMIPLVENVFKHGINKRSEDNLLIIHITVREGSIELEVRNRIFADAEPVSGGGNGLVNLASRLHLLYGNKHTLHTEKKEGLFVALLKIPV